jgi:GAF domain-containing protein
MDRYERIYQQLQELIEAESPTLTAAMATICAVLHHKMSHHSWTGFYFLISDTEMHIGPYQGPVACQVLRDTGVCLESARTGQPVVVPNVHEFPGHIVCDDRSMSEIVLPVMKGEEVIAVLDIDSHKLEQFTDDDVDPLTKILDLLQPFL